MALVMWQIHSVRARVVHSQTARGLINIVAFAVYSSATIAQPVTAAPEAWTQSGCEATAGRTAGSTASVPHYCYGLWDNDLAVVRACTAFPIDFNQRCGTFHSPLNLAAYRTSVAAVDALLRAGAKPHAHDINGSTALHSVASDRCTGARAEDCRELIRRFVGLGLSPNERNRAGMSPFWNAVWYADVETVKLMLDMGADINQRAHLGKTPLDWAYEVKSTEKIALLEQRDAKRGGWLYGIRDFFDRLTNIHLGH